MPLEEAAARCGQGGFVWLGLFEPGAEELAQVRDTFGLHELAVEDAQSFHLRPKVESYDGDVQLVILRTARYDDDAEEVDFGEISVFLAPTFVIAVRQGVASELRGARPDWSSGPSCSPPAAHPRCGRSWIRSWTATRPWSPASNVTSTRSKPPCSPERWRPTERIYSLRREATEFYRAVHPLLGVVATIERVTAAPELQPYLRDVHDHLLLVNEEVAAQRDLLGTVLEANLAVISVEQTKVSVRQNATIEQLTILATVFLPLTFVTGFFGQNFAWLVGHITSLAAFLVHGFGGLAVPLALLFWWLRLRRPHPSTGAASPGGLTRNPGARPGPGSTSPGPGR